MNKIFTYLRLFQQFGLNYSLFRVKYELSKKLGLMKFRFSDQLKELTYLDIDLWRQKKYQDLFFLSDFKSLNNELFPSNSNLQDKSNRILNGEVLFFFNDWKTIKKDCWNVHPVSNHNYTMKHWSKLDIYDRNIGDIKYVWEKSKFSYLLYVARNDFKSNSDHSKFVFSEIESWITANSKPNIGPQFICSQEISIRLMNWSFLLFFYSQSENLNEELFQKILNYIQVQLDHIYKNINFSRIAVRNNHAVTECLVLYLIPTYFPFLNNAKKYKRKGLDWFEKEVKYQLYEDGSDNQFSFNYHRVKVQLLSWYIATARVNNEKLSEVVIDRARKTVDFLYNMMSNYDQGYLPNFGANDGSIYFKLNDCDYRDFRPQLKALATLLNTELSVFAKDSKIDEDAFYFTNRLIPSANSNKVTSVLGSSYYKNGGYFLINESNCKTLFKTPVYNDRIGQDDYFHVDIWYNGINYFMDTGSYLYNTSQENLNYFNGFSGHNSVSVNGENHLEKGPLFTWLKKPLHLMTEDYEDENSYFVVSSMQLYYPYEHKLTRSIEKKKNVLTWVITDEIQNMRLGDHLIQNWNYNPDIEDQISIQNISKSSNNEVVKKGLGEYSLYYGSKQKLNNIKISTQSFKIITEIKIT